MRGRHWLVWTLLVGALWTSLAYGPSVNGQGLLVDNRANQSFRLPRPPILPGVPHPTSTYKIKQLAMQATLVDQIAKVQVTQTFVNTGSVPMEVSFVFPLPYDGAVDRLTFLVDGKEFDAKLLDATEARKIYEDYIRRNQDPALLEWLGHGLFRTSVFPVPPGAERTVTLRFSQLCRHQAGVTELLFPLSTARYTAQPVESVSLRVALESATPLKNIYSPSHAVDIKRPDDKHAVVSYEGKNEIPLTDFRLLYDIGKQAVGASVLSYRPDANDDGYFLLLVSPEIRQNADALPKKNVVFVVDRSGSMSGKKMDQAKSALKFVLNNLRDGDLFNIVAYDTEVESFRPELQKFNDETRKQALGFVEGLFAGGSTNIDGALKVALDQLSDNSRPNYVIFLTDGLPTAGVTGESQIAENAKQRNKVRARMFVFGVGYDVNSRLLDRLSRGGFGLSEYVRPEEDIEAHVATLYRQIGAPALVDVKLNVDVEGTLVEQGPVVNRVYPKDSYDLFAGDQLVVVGRYRKPGTAKLSVAGTIEGQKQAFSFPGELVAKSTDESRAFIEKLWATRRVGEIIDQIDLQGKNKELIDELIALSKRHGILTPYTSFLADDRLPMRDMASMRRRADENLDALKAVAGAGGFAQRSEKRNLQFARSAPMSGGAAYREAESDKVVSVRTVQNIGTKSFFFRDNRWVDSSLPEKKDDQPATKIKRYSDEYFALARKHGDAVARYLSLEGNLTLVIEGQTYDIED